MEHNVRIVEPGALMQQLPDLLQETDSIPLIITGSSMAPFLIHGRDTVYLSKVTQPLKKGDMILYRRSSGAYVLHRIYRVQDGAYDLVGDSQQVIEPHIRDEQIIAVVKAVRRNGKLLRAGNPCWEFFARIWLELVPVRSDIFRMWASVKAWRKQK